MKIIVDIRNYTNYTYEEYLYGGSPQNNPYVLGQVVAISEDNRSGEKGKETLGVVLGCITKDEVRTDAHGMVPIEDIRPATINDFGNTNIHYIERLKKECQGLAVVKIAEYSQGEERQDSLWYYGKQIATVRKGDKTFIVESTGEQRIYVDKSGLGDFEDCGRYDNEFATKKCKNAGLFDDDLNNSDKVHFEMNSWFAIRELDAEGNATDDVAICDSYDEAIALAEKEMNNPTPNGNRKFPYI
jgi:hypothetical protein